MKSLNLLQLKKNGIKIPDLTVFKFENLVKNDWELLRVIEEFKQQDFNNLTYYSEKLQKIICTNYQPVETVFNETFYAVRSSCNFEDGENYSFAGIFESYLNVSHNDINKYIKACLKSLFSVKALEYIILKKLDLKLVRMDVIVQTMVDADISGVLFFPNPLGIFNEVMISVAKGLGDRVVSDEVETIAYYYNLHDKCYYLDGNDDILNEAMIKTLIAEVYKIKTILNIKYVDIEFSFKDNELYILQARPITSLDDSSFHILDNSNIVESYPHVTLPLTDSFACMVYSGIFKGVAKRILKNEQLTLKYDDLYLNMVKSMNGRMYYQIDNWYKILQFLPFDKIIIPIWQDMLGVKNKDYPLRKINLPYFSKLKTYFNFFSELVKTPKAMDNLNKQFIEIYAYFNESFNEDLSVADLKILFNEIKEKLLNIWDITLINDMYAFIFTGLLKAGLKRKYPDSYEEKLVGLISGICGLESLQPIKALVKLAILKNKNDPGFKEEYRNYLINYGDRCLEELKLESETFKTNPKLLDEKINVYLKDTASLYRLNEELKHEVHNVEEGFIVKQAMIGIKNRELSRLNRTRIFGMVRAIFLSVAKKYQAKGLIENVNDIFYLTMDEVWDLADNPQNKKEDIFNRKVLYENFKQLPAYSRLIVNDLNIQKTFRNIKVNDKSFKDDILYGQANYAKNVKGEVVVILDPKNTIDVKDKIIVAKMTDPGWVFLLSIAKGIIVEKGSLLSHTAIISRELKIPAIIGVDKATKILKTGDVVKIDSNYGLVKIVKRG